ncbi:CREG1 protein [Danaus plexippus plexippus]|uniref:CREG1 protein n=1 Tax=Danaus plexippus plexippus TaxID=278856 RepID=A0A212F1K8_DANPL|nr:CREG1 protein [Danaus plexippus plexippus]
MLLFPKHTLLSHELMSFSKLQEFAKVKENTPEYTFAKAALFERHPDMANFPPDHNWFVAKMKIAQIAMVDWFGGAKYVPVKDYLAYNYTGMEMLH